MGGILAEIDWKVVGKGLEQSIHQLRNFGLGLLFVEIAQTRAMRSAGTLASAMLSVESAFIRAHFSALQWGFATNEALVASNRFMVVSEAVEEIGQKIGELRGKWLEAAAAGGFAFTAGLRERVQLEIAVAMHPGVEEALAMDEQARLQEVAILQARLHLAVSQMMLRQNIRIADIAMQLLQVQIIQSGALIGGALGGPPGAAVGLAIGLGVAYVTGEYFREQREQMLSTTDTLFDLTNRVFDASGSAEELNTTFQDLNDEIKDLIGTFRDFGTTVKSPSKPKTPWTPWWGPAVLLQ